MRTLHVRARRVQIAGIIVDLGFLVVFIDEGINFACRRQAIEYAVKEILSCSRAGAGMVSSSWFLIVGLGTLLSDSTGVMSKVCLQPYFQLQKLGTSNVSLTPA